MNTQETSKIMEILTAAYPRFYANSSKDEKIKAFALWAEMFKDYPVTVVAYAVKAFIAEDTKGFPPAIGQIMERVRLLTDKPQTSAEEAWDMVYKAICRSAWHAEEEYAKLPDDIKAVVRSPHQLWQWAIDEHFNAGVESSNFKRAYNTVIERNKRIEGLPEDVKIFISASTERIEG